jgi:cyanophycinase
MQPPERDIRMANTHRTRRVFGKYLGFGFAIALAIGLAPEGVLRAASPTAPAEAAADAPYKYIRIGNAQDVETKTQPGYALLGGGTDVDEAFQWLCRRSGGGDFLVVRASGTDAYNPYIQSLCHENSVATLIIPSRAAAQNRFVAQTIRHAEAIFISGGDQSNYVNFWRGTPVERALNDAIRRGVPMGGTSAGLAVLGEFAYTAQGDAPNGPNLSSAMALANPFHPQVTIVRGFLRIPALRATITDTHFSPRDRLGRLLVFLARILASGAVTRIHGIGVDQHTAFLLDADGRGHVAGTGAVYFFAPTRKPEICRLGIPLTFTGISVHKLKAGEKFGLAAWTGDGISYTLSVEAGKIRSSQPGGAIY